MLCSHKAKVRAPQRNTNLVKYKTIAKDQWMSLEMRVIPSFVTRLSRYLNQSIIVRRPPTITQVKTIDIRPLNIALRFEDAEWGYSFAGQTRSSWE